jgi:osmotically-inducible protein OsmY
MINRTLAALVVGGLVLSGCGPEKRTVGLDVDVFLHPNSAELTDVLLQTAITKRLADDEQTQRGIIHVRVVDGAIVLSGAVRSSDLKNRAEMIARETVLKLNETPIRSTAPVSNRIEIQR